MKLEKFIKLLEQNSIKYLKNASLKFLNSFKVDAYADLLVFPDTSEKLCLIISLINRYNFKHFILGNGTNVVFQTQHYNGIVVSTRLLKNVTINENIIEAECGVSATGLSQIALNNSLSGLEFCYGIPGSVGGVVYMNASAYGSQVSDVVDRVEYYDCLKNEICYYTKNDNIFSTKMSVFQSSNEVV
jgi:UDP-N-acetylmuramate dehydrogenase